MYNERVIKCSKYQLFQQNLDNKFYQPKQKETFIQSFCKFQKTYFGFCKLAQLFKLKKIKSEISYDLCFNVINEKSKIEYSFSNHYMLQFGQLLDHYGFLISVI